LASNGPPVTSQRPSLPWFLASPAAGDERSLMLTFDCSASIHFDPAPEPIF
jgi:hypothetical protein